MTHINQRRDLASEWTAANPVLNLGEVGWERNTRKAKTGDGETPWNSLPYSIEPLDDYAKKDSPAFTGNPTAPTPATADNDTSIATTAFVKAQGYAAIASPTFTGDPKAPTPATADNDTSIATTAFVKAQGYAPTASPTFTGDPKAPTPATGDNDTSIATTAFVKNQGYAPTASPTFTGDPKAPTPVTTDNDTSIATTAFVNALLAVRNSAALTTSGISSGGMTYTHRNGVVSVDIAATTLTASLAAGSQLSVAAAGAIPAAFRPLTPSYASIFSGTSVGWLRVNSDGSADIRALTGALPGAFGTATYVL